MSKHFRRKRLDWPLHVTLLQWFTLEQNLQPQLLARLHDYAVTVRPESFTIGDDAYFGVDNDIPVSKVIDTGVLHIWHAELLKLVEQAGGVIDAEKRQWVGEAYQPHVTHHGTERLYAGETLTLNNFTVTILKDDDMCEVITCVPLGTDA